MVESLERQLRDSALYYSGYVMQASHWAPKSAFSFSNPFFFWPCGEQLWRIYRPQEDWGCTYLALSTDSEGYQKLLGSLLLLQTPCLWLFWHCQTPLQANRGQKRILVDQRVLGWVSPAKSLADNSSHFRLPNYRQPVHPRYRGKQHWPLKSKGGTRRWLHSTASRWARARETTAWLIRNF